MIPPPRPKYHVRVEAIPGELWIFVDLRGVVDYKKEFERAKLVLQKNEKEVIKLEKLLENSKLPENKIEESENKLHELIMERWELIQDLCCAIELLELEGK